MLRTNIGLSDPRSLLTFLTRGGRFPECRWHRDEPNVLLKYLHSIPPTKCVFRDVLLQVVGLTEAEIAITNLRGPLDELRASYLQPSQRIYFPRRPFNIGLTNKPSEHLTFGESGGRPTLRLLDFDGIFKLYVPQRVGLASYILSYCY